MIQPCDCALLTLKLLPSRTCSRWNTDKYAPLELACHLTFAFEDMDDGAIQPIQPVPHIHHDQLLNKRAINEILSTPGEKHMGKWLGASPEIEDDNLIL